MMLFHAHMNVEMHTNGINVQTCQYGKSYNALRLFKPCSFNTSLTPPSLLPKFSQVWYYIVHCNCSSIVTL